MVGIQEFEEQCHEIAYYRDVRIIATMPRPSRGATFEPDFGGHYVVTLYT